MYTFVAAATLTETLLALSWTSPFLGWLTAQQLTGKKGLAIIVMEREVETNNSMSCAERIGNDDAYPTPDTWKVGESKCRIEYDAGR